jgi:branched-chain amino acid transport system ATP-binding protein
MTILLIEQNVQQTLEMADRGYVMENGQIVLTGLGRELLGNAHLKTHYLGV